MRKQRQGRGRELGQERVIKSESECVRERVRVANHLQISRTPRQTLRQLGSPSKRGMASRLCWEKASLTHSAIFTPQLRPSPTGRTASMLEPRTLDGLLALK